MGALREFQDLESFALHMLSLEVAVRASTERALDKALVVIENYAKAEIGYYQPEVGEFPAWAPLAEATEAEKARLGAPPGAPLMRNGGLYASFQHEAHGDEGAAGSTDPVMVYHEFGTSKMPPRPVWGPAAINTRERIQKIIGHALVEGILGGEAVAAGDYFGGDITP